MTQKRTYIIITLFFFTFCNILHSIPTFSNFGYTTFTCSSTTKTFTLNITDPTPIASGTLSPRVYFKKNNNPYSSSTGTLISGSLTNGTWQFTLNYSLTNNDFVYFYVVAQNNLGVISSYPNTAFAAIDVNNITSPPNNPLGLYYGLLSGTYNVGAGGYFTRLTDAAIAYSSACFLLGPVTFVLTDTAYTNATGEGFPITFTNRSDASPTNSLLIKPASGINVSIRGDTITPAVIKFQHASYFTFDGFNGTGNGINIYCGINTNSLFNSAIWLSSLPTFPTSKKGVIKHLNIYSSRKIFGSLGIFISSNSESNPNVGTNIDSIEIINNNIQKATKGILAYGSITPPKNISALSIISNTIGLASTTSTLNHILHQGIWTANTTNCKVSDNIITNCGTGVYINKSQNASISNNTISAIDMIIFNADANGILIEDNNGGIIENNFITDVSATYTSSPVSGLSVINCTNTSIRNNAISDIRSKNATADFKTWPIGIYLHNSSFIKIDYNSVNLYGSNTSLTGNASSSAVLINTTVGINNLNLSVRNNIFSNTYNHANSGTDTCYAFCVRSAISNFISMDNNDYYVGGTGNTPILCKELIGPSFFATLPAIQSAFGNNFNSVNVAPVFVAPNDLHLVNLANPLLDDNAQVISGINTDFDKLPRSNTTPDIGADEINNTAPCVSSTTGSIFTPTASVCSGLNAALSFSGSVGVGMSYQWKISNTSGGPYTNVVGGAGANTTNYTTPALPVGTYYYVLEKTCNPATMTSISNEATVTIKPIPTATATATQTLICPFTPINLIGMTNIGNTFQWTNPSIFYSSTLQNPSTMPVSSSGTYYFTASLNGCTSPVSSVSYSILPTYQIFTSVSPSTVICAGSSATLNATGAVTYTFTNVPPNIVTYSNSIVITPTTSAWQYSVTGTDVNGCMCLGSSGAINLFNSPYVNVTMNPICVGQSPILDIFGASTHTWSTGQTTYSISVSPSVTTTYTVGGISTSNCNYSMSITVNVNTCTSVNEVIKENFDYGLFPNPNQGNFIIQQTETESSVLVIYNSIGQLITTLKLVPGLNQINLQNISGGLYYYNIETEKGIKHTGKFMID